MDWIAVDVHIAGDAVTHRLADAFRLRVAEAAGLLTLAFTGMAQHAQDGSLSSITDSQIESWALWHGKRGAFATFFRLQLCDDDGTVRAWEKYNGASIREAKAARERMREYRAKKKAERTPHGSANGTANGTRDVRHNLTRPDLTGPRKQRKASAASPPTADGVSPEVPAPSAPQAESLPPKPDPFPKPICDAVYEAWLAQLGAVDYGRLRKALLPLYRSTSAEHPTAEQLVGAVAAFLDARDADDPKFRTKYTPETFAAQLHDYVRMGAMPYVDGWGEPTERGRMAKVLS